MATKKRPPDPPDDDDDDDAGSFTDRQREEIARVVNASVGNQLGRKLDARISEVMTGALAPIAEQLAKINGGNGEPKAKGSDRADESKGDPDGMTKRERELQARVDEQDRKFAKLEADRRAERDGARNAARDSRLREELGKVGVDPLRMKGALAVIRDAVKIDDKTGELSYKAAREGYEEDLDLSRGVKEWADTDEGKSYRAPQAPKGRAAVAGAVNVVGSGERPNGGRAAAEQQKAAVKSERKAAALDTLGAAVGSLIGGANLDLGG
jgi:hypothetical protein